MVKFSSLIKDNAGASCSIYTGIGSRSTPEGILKQMTILAIHLASIGLTLRSGAADGADAAFESGAGSQKEIFLPWRGFNSSTSQHYEVSQEALNLAGQIHPIFNQLKPSVQRLHARNTYQVLGKDLNTPSLFVICYTPCGSEDQSTLTSKSGGTATAIKLASSNSIPVFNLNRPDAINRLYTFIGKLSCQRPRVLNSYKHKSIITQDDIYIGRGSPYGNPFVIGEQYTRDQVCDLFEKQTLPTLDVEPLRGKNVVCFCSPARCHGHSIFKKLYGTTQPLATLPLKPPMGYCRRDKTNPTYEVSSVGDKRFSALYARLQDGRTIEENYQLDAKGFRKITQNWKEAKGKPPINGKSFDQLYIEYKSLWLKYLQENINLYYELKARTSCRVITDCFSSTQINQARALYEIIMDGILES